MTTRPIVYLLFAVASALGALGAPQALEQSEVIEAVNDVTLITMPAGSTAPARRHDQLHAPDRLRTGRASRAELQAPDGTITRLGANTLFAFDRATRSMQLDRGSVLFHSPTGRGGGTIKSPSASASVLGTTIIAAATADGGFKLLVLEGRARVDFTTGARRELNAGQMLFVRPGGLGTGTPGPTIHFDLERQVKNSNLVKGFKRPLASQPKIDRAIADQRRAVGQGRYLATGFLVYAATSDTQVNGIEAAGPDADDSLVGDFNQHQKLALNSDVTLASATLPANRVFRAEFLIPATESEFLNLESDTLLTGLLGRTVTIASPELSFADAGVPAFNLVGKQAIVFTGSTTFTNLAAKLDLRDTHFLLEGDFWADAGDTAALTRLTWAVAPTDAVFQTTAVNLIDAQALNFDGFATINLGARTIALTDVAFPAGSTVRLVSETGQLAPAPNTGAAVQPGFVNFVRDVTYGGAPAQDHVPIAAGGTGLGTPRITITTPNPGN